MVFFFKLTFQVTITWFWFVKSTLLRPIGYVLWWLILLASCQYLLCSWNILHFPGLIIVFLKWNEKKFNFFVLLYIHITQVKEKTKTWIIFSVTVNGDVPWVPEVFLAGSGNFRCWLKANTSSAVGRIHERQSREKNLWHGAVLFTVPVDLWAFLSDYIYANQIESLQLWSCWPTREEMSKDPYYPWKNKFEFKIKLLLWEQSWLGHIAASAVAAVASV